MPPPTLNIWKTGGAAYTDYSSWLYNDGTAPLVTKSHKTSTPQELSFTLTDGVSGFVAPDAGNRVQLLTQRYGTWFQGYLSQVPVRRLIGGQPFALTYTRLQSTGGSTVDKYYIDLGAIVVGGHSYIASVFVLNQGNFGVFVNPGTGNGVQVLVPAGSFAYVQIPFTTDGGHAEIKFICANLATDLLDLLVFQPAIYDVANGTNLVPSAKRDFSGWIPINSAAITLTQGQKDPTTGPTYAYDCVAVSEELALEWQTSATFPTLPPFLNLTQGAIIKALIAKLSSPVFTDEFNRPALGPDWTLGIGTFATLNSADVYSTSAQGTFSSMARPGYYPNDQYAQATISNVPAVGSGASVGLLVRADALATTFYGFLFNAVGTRGLYRYNAGAQNILITNTGANPAQGDVLKLTVIGNTITGYINGTAVITFTDATLTTGSPGIFIRAQGNTTGRLDHWSAGPITPPLDVTNVQAGITVPFFRVRPDESFGDAVRRLSDKTNMAFWTKGGLAYYQPYSTPLGYSPDESDVLLDPYALDVQPVQNPVFNDVLGQGGEEPQAYAKEFFVGDGLTGTFPLKLPAFGTQSQKLLEDDFVSSTINTGTWLLTDVNGLFGPSVGSLGMNCATSTLVSRLTSILGLEIAAFLELRAGRITFGGASNVLVGCLMGADTGLLADVVAGFQCLPSGSQTIIRPIVNGAVFSTNSYVTLTGKNYQFTLTVDCTLARRVRRPFFSLYNSYGGSTDTADALVTFSVIESDIANPDSNSVEVLSVTARIQSIAAFLYFTVLAGPQNTADPVAVSLNFCSLRKPPQAALYIRSPNGTIENAANRDFEQASTIPPPEWTALNATLSYETAAPQSGIRSLIVTATAANGDAHSVSFPVLPGGLYTVSGYVNSANQGLIGLWLYDASGAQITFITVAISVTSGWQFISASGTAPSNAVTGVIRLQANSSIGAVAKFDQVSCVGPKPWKRYRLGDKADPLARAMLTPGTDSNSALEFLGDTAPQPMDLVKFIYSSTGIARARVRLASSIATEAAKTGDNGIRTGTLPTLAPAPRDAAEFERACQAYINDRTTPLFSGRWTLNTKAYAYGLQTIADAFNRANANPIGANWTTCFGQFACQIVSNQVQGTSTASPSASFYSGIAFPNDQWAQAVLITQGASCVSGVAVRSTGAQQCYVGGLNGQTGSVGTAYIGILTQSTGITVLASVAYTPQVNDVFRLEVTGNFLTLKVNGVILVTATDNSYSSGSPGIMLFPSAAVGNGIIDSFAAGNLENPVPGRLITVNAPTRYPQFTSLATQVDSKLLTLDADGTEIIEHAITFGPLTRLDDESVTFQPADDAFLGPLDQLQVVPPIDFASVGSAFASEVTKAEYSSRTPTTITLDAGAAPTSTYEVRKTDSAWGAAAANKALSPDPSTQTFALARSGRDLSAFIKNKDGSGLLSRYPAFLRFIYPLVPGAPMTPAYTIVDDALNILTNVQLPSFLDGNNLLLRSEQFDNAAWTKNQLNAITPNTIADPNAGVTADALIPSGGATDSYALQAGPAVVTGEYYTFSVWLRVPAGTKTISIFCLDGAGSTALSITITTVWTRYQVTRVGGASGNIQGKIGGGNTWVAATGEIDCWGAQLEQAPVAGAYLQTVAAASYGRLSDVFGYQIRDADDATVLFDYRDILLATALNPPALTWKWTNPSRLTSKTLYARFYNLLGEYSDRATFTIASIVPSDPSSVTGQSGNTTALTRGDGVRISRIKIAWTASATTFDGANGFVDIEYSLTGINAWLTADIVAGDKTSAYVTGVDDGVGYDVRIRSRNANGGTSNWVQITNHIVSTITHGSLSYRPTTDPLTGHDAGASVSITFVGWTMRIVGVGDISYTASGSITALAYNTLYYVYYDDATLAGGAVTVVATTLKSTALGTASGRFYLGSILTPRAGAPDTAGNGDGGGGAQNGIINVLSMSASALTQALGGNGTSTNLGNAIDGDQTTYAAFTATANAAWNYAISRFSAPPGIERRYSSAVLKVLVSVPTNNLGTFTGTGTHAAALIQYSIGGGGLVDLLNLNGGVTQALTLLTFTIPQGTNLSQMAVQSTCQSGNEVGGKFGTGSIEVRVFEAWIEATE